MAETSSDEGEMDLMEQFSDWDSDSHDEGTQVSRRNPEIRNNHMVELNNREFTYRFRITKEAVNDLVTRIHPDLKVTSKRNHGISPLHQVLLTLRFYALGTMLVSVADYIGVSVPSACRIVSSVSAAIANLYPEYVKLEETTVVEFFNIAGFPLVHGAIDCTHVPIQSPNSDIGEEFRNRKGTMSINVQGVCNANLMFLNVVARWPGSSHDATIFNNSNLKYQCEDGVLGNRWLLGDSAYPCKPYLLTPLLHPRTRSEQLYNEAHIKTRNTIERCFGVWKRRFPVLALKLRLALHNSFAVIIATAVLHNICRKLNLEDMEPEVEMSLEDITMEPHNNSDQLISERQQLIDSYFT